MPIDDALSVFPAAEPLSRYATTTLAASKGLSASSKINLRLNPCFAASASRESCACGVHGERAEVLNCAGSDTKPGRCLPHGQSGRTCLTDAGYQFGGYRWPTELFALALGPSEASTHTFLDHGALELGFCLGRRAVRSE